MLYGVSQTASGAVSLETVVSAETCGPEGTVSGPVLADLRAGDAKVESIVLIQSIV